MDLCGRRRISRHVLSREGGTGAWPLEQASVAQMTDSTSWCALSFFTKHAAASARPLHADK